MREKWNKTTESHKNVTFGLYKVLYNILMNGTCFKIFILAESV